MCLVIKQYCFKQCKLLFNKFYKYRIFIIVKMWENELTLNNKNNIYNVLAFKVWLFFEII